MTELRRKLAETATAQWLEWFLSTNNGTRLKRGRPPRGEPATDARPGAVRFDVVKVSQVVETRNLYYGAILSLAEDGTPTAGSLPELEEVLLAVGVRKPTTLYNHFGRRVTWSLGSHLWERHPELAKTLNIKTPLGCLVAETKVYAYGPAREGWLTELSWTDVDRRFAAETLVRVVAQWAVQVRRLAALADGSPPATAVEDLLVLSGGRAEPSAAYELLARVVRTALDARGLPPLSVLNSVYRQLDELGIDRRLRLVEVVGPLREALIEAGRRIPRLVAADRSEAAASLTPLLRRITGQLNGAL